MACTEAWGVATGAVGLLVTVSSLAAWALSRSRAAARCDSGEAAQLDSFKREVISCTEVAAALAAGDFDAVQVLGGDTPLGAALRDIAESLREWYAFVPQLALEDPQEDPERDSGRHPSLPNTVTATCTDTDTDTVMYPADPSSYLDFDTRGSSLSNPHAGSTRTSGLGRRALGCPEVLNSASPRNGTLDVLGSSAAFPGTPGGTRLGVNADWRRPSSHSLVSKNATAGATPKNVPIHAVLSPIVTTPSGLVGSKPPSEAPASPFMLSPRAADLVFAEAPAKTASPKGRARRRSRNCAADAAHQLRMKHGSVIVVRTPSGPDRLGTTVGATRGGEHATRIDRFVHEALCFVEQYEGRAVDIGAEELVAVWNMSRACPLHGQRASQCALAISRSMRNHPHVQEGGAGICTGNMMVGIVGTAKQLSAIAIGAPVNHARLLAQLCPVLEAAAVADEAAYAAASSAVRMRVVDTVAFDNAPSGYHTALVYEVSVKDYQDAGYCAGFAAMLSGKHDDATALFSEHVRLNARDVQGRRLLRLAATLRDDPACADNGYFRKWLGWERWERQDGCETPRGVGDLLRQTSQLSTAQSVVGGPNGRRSVQLTDDVLLRQQIEAARHARAVTADGADGTPKAFVDQRGTSWHRSAQMLGKGAFGVVWLGMSADATMVAIKSMTLPEEDQQTGEGARRRSRRRKTGCEGATQVDELLKEVQLMLQLRHENVVSFLGSAVQGGHILIVMEYCSGGSLQMVLTRFGGLPAKTVKRYTRDMLKGLQFLHEKDIVHRDLKPHNVLVTVEGAAKLADFGASAELQSAVAENQGVIGTPLFMAPEAARGNAAKPSDVWGVGLVVCLLLTSRLPWPCAEDSASFNPHQFLYRLANDADFSPELPDELPGEARSFVGRCLVVAPGLRPTAQELLKDVYVLQ